MHSKVSIALATYNGEKYLYEQLSSFVSQTRQPDELVVCDDQSSDQTVNILREFSRTAPFKVLVFVNDENLGYSQNFSKALSLCSGDYVFLSDQDDVWSPNKIQRVLATFESNEKVQLIIHDIEFCKENLTPIGQTKIQRMQKSYDLQSDYVVGMATCIKKDFLDICLPIPEEKEVSHDFWLHKCAASVGVKGIIYDVLALHRRHSQNETSHLLLNVDYATNKWIFELLKIKNKIKNKQKINSQSGYFLEWLKENRSFFIEKNYLSLLSCEEILSKENDRIGFINERVKLSSMGRLKRVPKIIKLVSSGGYRNFSGWKSIVRDLLF